MKAVAAFVLAMVAIPVAWLGWQCTALASRLVAASQRRMRAPAPLPEPSPPTPHVRPPAPPRPHKRPTEIHDAHTMRIRQ